MSSAIIVGAVVAGFPTRNSVRLKNVTISDNVAERCTDISPLPFVTLDEYNATGDGVTDDSAAMASAIDAVSSGGVIQLGAGKTYLVGSGAPYSIPSNVSIVGCGDSSILKTTANTTLLLMSGVSRTSLQNFKILGSATGTSQVGIANGVSGTANSGDGRAKIVNVSIESMGGNGIQLYNYDTLNSDGGGSLALGALLQGVRVEGCGGYGIYVGTYAEYTVIVGPRLNSNHDGVYVGAGNLTVVGGEVTNHTTYGFNIAPATNDGHGMVVGTAINHNNVPVYAHGITKGFDFVGCHIWVGLIEIGDTSTGGATGVHFIGGQIDADAYYFNGSTGTVFDGVCFPSINANTVNNSFGGHASTTFWGPNCTKLDGTWPAFIGTAPATWFKQT